jgi:hypothetical protein
MPRPWLRAGLIESQKSHLIYTSELTPQDCWGFPVLGLNKTTIIAAHHSKNCTKAGIFQQKSVVGIYQQEQKTGLFN